MQTLNSVIKCAGSSAHLMLLEVTVRKYKVRAQLVVGRKYIQQIKVLSSVYLFVSPASQVVPTSHITLAVSAPPPAAPRKRDESSPVEKAPAAICLAKRLSELSQRRSARRPANLALKLEGEETQRRRGETHFIATSQSR